MLITGYPAARWMNFIGHVESAGEIRKEYAVLVA